MAEAGHLVPEVAGTLGSISDRRGWNDDFDRAGAFIPVPTERLFVGSEWKDEVARPLTAVEHGHRYDFDTENIIVEAYNVHGEHSTAMTGNGNAEVAFPTETSRCIDSQGAFATNQGSTVVAEGRRVYPLANRGREEGAQLELGPEDGPYNALRAGDGGSSRQSLILVDEGCEDDEGRPLTGHGAMCIHSDALSRSGDNVTPTPNNPGDKPTLRDPGLGVIWEDRSYALKTTSWPHAIFDNGQGDPNFSEGDKAFAVNTQPHQGIAYSIYPESGQGSDLRAVEVDVAPALTATGISQVTDRGTFIAEEHDPLAIAENQRGELRTSEVSLQLTTGGGKAGQGYPAVWDTAMSVRRLTPTECERLQGFPDGWTKRGVFGVGLDGEPVLKVIPDSSRYRQLGNAVAVPVAAWLARRLVAVDERIHGGDQ